MRFIGVFIILSWLCPTNQVLAQGFGFQFREANSSIEIPFQMYNNLIVVDLVMEHKLPLKFIFDTGAEHTVVCKKEISQILGLKYDRAFTMLGADFKKILTAYLVKSIAFDLVNNLAQAKQDVLVLEEDYYNFDECTGQPISGIIGADLFNRYVVKIDYVRHRIKLIDPGKFKPPTDFSSFPIEIIKGKPYFYPQLALRHGEYFPVKLLLDTGAGLSLLLFNNTHPLLTPPPNSIKGTLALGLGGKLDGFIGKINALQLTEKIVFPNIITDFQDTGGLIDSSFAISRNGIFGERLLSRFDVIIDYINSRLYLKTNRNYKKPLEDDRSGLMIMAQGLSLNTYYINDVVPGSAANWADIRRGDEIVNVNHIPVSFLTIDDIYKKLRKKAGTRICITIMRNKRKYKKHLVLKDLF
jgi:hypothetical protein